nr:hypothetical protein [Jiangella alkaliphila]
MHDQTAVKTDGIDELLDLYPGVEAELDDGYKGLAKAHPGQVRIPPKKPGGDATENDLAAWRAARHAQSSTRICVEHGIGELKHWRPLQRWIGRRDDLPETIAAVASLVSDRAAAR